MIFLHCANTCVAYNLKPTVCHDTCFQLPLCSMISAKSVNSFSATQHWFNHLNISTVDYCTATNMLYWNTHCTALPLQLMQPTQILKCLPALPTFMLLQACEWIIPTLHSSQPLPSTVATLLSLPVLTWSSVHCLTLLHCFLPSGAIIFQL